MFSNCFLGFWSKWQVLTLKDIDYLIDTVGFSAAQSDSAKSMAQKLKEMKKDVRDGDHILINAEVEAEPDSMTSIIIAPIDPDTTTIAAIKKKSLLGSLLKLYFRGEELKDPWNK